MGWFGDLVDKLKSSPADDLVFVDGLDCPDSEGTPDFARDECYVELYVESLRLEKSRSFATRFHGVVYSFVTLARDNEANTEIAAVSKPDKIAEVDDSSLGKVITLQKQMMGAVPWRGGQLQLQLGLFAVKAGNLLSPVIDFVTRVSDTAGISFVGAIKPFVPLITEGMDMIAGQTQDSKLQVGLDTAISLEGKRPMSFAIVAAKKGTIDPSKLTFDATDRKLLYNGSPLQQAYCVFSIRSNARKADYGAIPEIKAAIDAFKQAVVRGVQKEAADALTVLRRTILVSPDLIPADGLKLVADAEKKLRLAFPGGGISGSTDQRKALFDNSEAGLEIYD